MSYAYAVTVSITVAIWILLALSLNIVTGYARLPHLGQAAFLGIGAYTVAILSTGPGLDFWLALAAATVVTAFFGSLLGLVSLRMREDFLAFTTIGLNFIVVGIFLYHPLFGKSFGIGGIPMPSILGVPFTRPVLLGFLVALIAGVAAGSKFLERSWAGMALRAVGDDDLTAQTIGINVFKFKVLAFTLSTGLAGLVGGFYAAFFGYIAPGDFGFLTSIVVVAMLIVGGNGTVHGAIVGAALLGALPEIFREIETYRILFYGGLLVLVMIFLPSGLLGPGSPLVRWWMEGETPETAEEEHA